MDNLKEQIAKEIVEYDFTGFNPKWIECANKSHWLNLATKILSIIEQAGYAQLQTGEDGLIKLDMEDPCETCNASINEQRMGCQISCVDYGVYQSILRNVKAQKNLDDKRIEQINSTDKIEIFIDGKKTVFVREGKKEEEITSLLRKIVGQNGWIYQEDFTNIKKLFSEMESK